MIIGSQNRGMLVTYIQAFLKEFFGVNLIKSVQYYARATKDRYEIRQSDSLRISGVYTSETYTAIAIYMAYNYPNEQFPERWDRRSEGSSEWVRTPFNQTKVTDTMNYLIETNFIDSIGDELTEKDYNKHVTDFSKYLTFDEICKYFDSALNVYDTLYSKKYSDVKKYTPEDVRNNLIYFLANNLDVFPYQNRSIEIGDRVISYFLDEVVTSASNPDEIMRVQELMYPDKLSYSKVGKFFSADIGANGEVIRPSMEDDIKKIQQDFINKHTSSKGVFVPPEGFSNFKVTGYVDPWTEWVIKVR